MRSSLSRTARQLSRNGSRLNVQCRRAAGARWTSTESGGHKWSTPLAKQLAEAITVRLSKILQLMSADDSIDHRSSPCRLVHATSPDLRPRRLLHRSLVIRQRPIRCKRRLCDIARNQSNIWRAVGCLGRGRMDCPRQKERGSVLDGSWPRKRDADGRYAARKRHNHRDLECHNAETFDS